MTPRHFSHRRQPAGLTLVEVLLTLALMVAIAGMAWPKMMTMFDGQRLRSAADQVRTACFTARADAINSGEIQALHFQPGTNSYSIGAWEEDAQAQTVQSSLAVSSAGDTTRQPAAKEGRLPDGIMFNAGSLGASGPSLAGFGGATAGSASTPGGVVSADAASASVSNFSGGNSSGSGGDPNCACLLFYPDGTASTSQILLENGDHRVLAIEVRGLTGDATVSDAPLPPEALR